MTTAIDLETTELLAALRAQVRGTLSGEAAVELLAAHESWLRRQDFRRLVDYTDVTGGPPLAFVRWADVAAADLTGSSTEKRVLAIAGSLAAGASIDLRDALPGLGEHTTGLVLRAVAHSTGHGDLVDIVVRYGKRFDPDTESGWTVQDPEAF
ncbi:hypothetical protein [Streptomyces sp. SID3343]|uniref:hypothetical protein n=1 Tax=Streptomyces sp. SID3343 TaxID=2690260 RepID=UPI001928173B|nr:hypothetical protein [Streptomyces sp. SID3343]